MTNSPPAPAPSYKKWAAVAAVAFSFLVLFCEVTGNTADPDLFIYLLYGKLATAARALPPSDPFSYLPTKSPFIFHEWAPSILFTEIYQKLGPAALQSLKYALWGLMLLFVWLANRARAVPVRLSLLPVTASLYLIQLAAASVRIQVFSYVFLAAAAFLWESARSGKSKRPLYFLPPLFLLWANCHAGFAFGLFLCLCYAADSLVTALQDRPRDPAARSAARAHTLAFLACLAATLANPFGLRLLTGIAAHAMDPEMGVIEWQSLPSAAAQGFVWQAASFLCLALAALLVSPAALRRDRPGLAVLLAAAALGYSHNRHVSLFALGFALYAPAWLAAALRSGALRKAAAALSLAALLFPLFCTAFTSVVNIRQVAGKGSFLSLLTPSTPAPPARTTIYPLSAVGFLSARGFSGRLCAPYEYAAFVLWYLYPRVQTALDGRGEVVFPKEVRKTFFTFADGAPGWRDFLFQYPADALLIPTDSRICELLEREPGWTMAYQDAAYTIFLRKDSPLPGSAAPSQDRFAAPPPSPGFIHAGPPSPDSLLAPRRPQ